MIHEVLQLIEEYKLGDTVRWILENNPSQTLPYHNFNHSLWVMYNAAENWRYQQCDEIPVTLLIAALFHDFGHSGGFYTNDSKNVRLAVNALRRLQQENILPELSPYCFSTIILLVESTTYPYVNSAHAFIEKNLLSFDKYQIPCVQCLRDADMMQNCNDTLLANFVGIKQEMFRHLDYKEYCQKSIDFLKSITYKTKRGIEVGKPQLDKAIAQLEMFQRLCF